MIWEPFLRRRRLLREISARFGGGAGNEIEIEKSVAVLDWDRERAGWRGKKNELVSILASWMRMCLGWKGWEFGTGFWVPVDKSSLINLYGRLVRPDGGWQINDFVGQRSEVWRSEVLVYCKCHLLAKFLAPKFIAMLVPFVLHALIFFK